MRHLRSSAATVVIAVALVSTACSGRAPTEDVGLGEGVSSEPEGPPTAESVVARPGDLPTGLQLCRDSGSMETYLDNIREISADTYDSVQATWVELQEAGAVDAYIAEYADTQSGCTFLTTGAPKGHEHGGLRTISSTVIEFRDEATAEAAYRADIFEQSTREGQPGVIMGPDSGLGLNSLVAVIDAPTTTLHQAVWQKGPFNLFLMTQNLSRAEFESAAAAQDARIP